LILGNVDYRVHMSDENDQLQRGLAELGWDIAGVGYGDGLADVQKLILRYAPEVVLCMDKRDWDPACVAKRKDIAFSNLGVLREATGILKLVIIKDAGTFQKAYEEFFDEVRPDYAVTYYEEAAVRKLNPWIPAGLPFVRIHHSVDAELIRHIGLGGERAGVLVSGARGWCYPLRNAAAKEAGNLGWDVLPHPGHHNRGAFTQEYLARLVGYRVHIATASSFGFALRKIIESVACGCTCVTNLPATDVLPEIDRFLLRVHQAAEVRELHRICHRACVTWNQPARLQAAEVALARYDYHEVCKRFDSDVMALYEQRKGDALAIR
jgi:hypothetical protein